MIVVVVGGGCPRRCQGTLTDTGNARIALDLKGIRHAGKEEEDDNDETEDSPKQVVPDSHSFATTVSHFGSRPGLLFPRPFCGVLFLRNKKKKSGRVVVCSSAVFLES